MMKLPSVIATLKDEGEAVLVPGGEFTYGIHQARVEEILDRLNQPKEPLFATEAVPAVTSIRDCYIDRYPVTNRQFAAFMKATGHPAPLNWNNSRWNRPDQPVVAISYRDAVAYARWAEKRLPTEQEWERAARGTDERTWPWGDEFDRRRCNCKELGAKCTTDVGRMAGGISPVGAYDMAGNVWELTSGDWEGFGKTIRGGSYANAAAYCRTTCRWGIDPDLRGSTWLGFRCVMELGKARIYARPKST